MIKLILAAVLFAGMGCRSVPRRELGTPEGVIAGHFNMRPGEVRELKDEKDISREELVRVLLISSSTYLSEDEVIEKRKDMEFDEIASGADLDPEFIEEEARRILEEAAAIR